MKKKNFLKQILAGILCTLLLVQGTPQMVIAMQMQDVFQVMAQQAKSEENKEVSEKLDNDNGEEMPEDGMLLEEERPEEGTIPESITLSEGGEEENTSEPSIFTESSENTEEIEIREIAKSQKR